MSRLKGTPLITATAVLAACGGGKNLDTAQVEKDINEIAAATGVEAKTECPDEVKDIKKGTTYECTVVYAGNESNKQTVQMKVGENDESEFVDQEATSDEVAIRGIVAQSDKDPATVCEHLSEEILEELGGEDCPTKAAEGDDGKPTVIKSIEIEGDAATMTTDESTTTFERAEDGSFIVTAIQ